MVVVSLSAAVLAGPIWALTADAIVNDFVDEVALTGLTYPTNVEFAPNGKVFVTEKSGKIKVFDSVTDPTPDVFADLGPEVHDFWDRGMLGLAIHPDFPTTPYIYVLYTYDAKPGGAPPTWGDACPTPPGATDKGCVVTGRLSRLTANGNVMVPGSEVVLVQDWCQQFPSHSIGDIEFGADGALYATGGDGASFNYVDYGQGPGDASNPKNPCTDPPVGLDGNQTPPTAEGGALRSQDMRTSGDPVTLDGTVIRINPLTGAALPDNPGISNSDANGKRIVAYGLRNPFRFVVKPGTSQLFIGDVGWNLWEEVNQHPNPGQTVLNFGWPCYEGGSGTSIRQAGYDAANLNICENLYTAGTGAVTAPLFAYNHQADISGNDACPPANPPQGTSSSISGLAFYTEGSYPGTYNGALFGSDYSRDCIWVMFPGAGGNPDPATVQVFQHLASNPVDLEAGPGGDIFYPDFSSTGSIHRIRFIGPNNPPNAVISANPTSGGAPLLVNFGSEGSTDPDSDALTFTWDLDDDGQFDDGANPTAQWTYDTPGTKTARLKATDSRGESDTDSVTILVSNSPPTPVIDTPAATVRWSVGSVISFSGHATDPDQGPLPASSLSWDLIIHHCADDGSCHSHPVQTFSGVASGSFTAPDHEYPSWLELTLTATDQFGSVVSTTRQLDPRTVNLTFNTSPPGLGITLGGVEVATPLTKQVIVNSSLTIAAQDQTIDESLWVFQSWSDGGDPSHTLSAPGTATTYTASFEVPYQPPPESCDFDGDGSGDLAVASKTTAGSPPGSGAVDVIYGSASGLTALGRQTWSQDSPGIAEKAKNGDQFGQGLACGDFDGDGFQDLAIGVPGEDFTGLQDAGVVNILYGSDTGLSSDGDQLIRRSNEVSPASGPVTVVTGKARKGDAFGTAVSSGDFDGDGFDDLAIGVPLDNVSGVKNTGSIDVVYGSATGLTASDGKMFHRGTTGVQGAPQSGANFGNTVASGDFDADGHADLVVGATNATSDGFKGAGQIHVFYGAVDGVTVVNDQKFSRNSPVISGAQGSDQAFGRSLAGGDFDGDGFDDLAIGVLDEPSGKSDAGSVDILFGDATHLGAGGHQLVHRDLPGIKGKTAAGDEFGASLAANDFDGDDIEDLAIGAPDDDHDGVAAAGSVAVVYGSLDGLTPDGDQIWKAGSAGLGGDPADFLRFGDALLALDFDGDGFSSLAIAAPGTLTGASSGSVTVVEGGPGGLSPVGSETWEPTSPSGHGLFGYRLP